MREGIARSSRSGSDASARSISVEQLRARQHAGIVVDLQRANARGEIDDARRLLTLQPLEQRLHAKAKVEVEHRLAVFDEQIAVARARHTQSPAECEATISGSTGKLRSGSAAPGCKLRSASSSVSGTKRTLSPGAKLANLPELGIDNDGGTNEAAEARTIGAENHRHVAREIDRADRVGVVVDVRWMQTRFAAILTRPLAASGRSAGLRCGSEL